MLAAEPVWTGIKPVSQVVPGMKPNYILHAGPPTSWADAHPVVKKGMIGGVLHEKLAKTADHAIAMLERGEVEMHPAHDFRVVGAGVGIVTASMTVNVCVDKQTGHEGYCFPFEGRVGLGVWGVYNEEVEANLQCIRTRFAPAVDCALQQGGGINIKNIIAKSMQMNDEIHTRQTAASLYLVSEIIPMLLRSGADTPTVNMCIDMFLSTERWFHPLGMASAMCMTRAIHDLDYCTLVTMICSNGVKNGLKIASTGDQWFYGPAPKFEGQYFSSQWGPDDASDHIGDSTITEVAGMGGFAAAAAPGVMRLRNGTYRDAIRQSEEMKQICVGINHNFPIPLLDFSGPPIGVDFRLVLDTGVTPICHGGIISKEGGQIGAGAGRFPIEPYKEALKHFIQKYDVA